MKSSVITIIGKPNSGKSTLFNRLIGHRLSIITPKVQTTRNIINGILTIDDAQLVFLDTPGIFESKTKLEKLIVKHAWASLNGADLILFLIDTTSKTLDEQQKNILNKICDKKVIIVFNKNDIKVNENLVEEVRNISKEIPIFHISALRGQNVEELLRFLVNNASNKEWMYDKDALTTLPMRFIAAEITREQLFLSLQQELPYNLKVDPEVWETKPDGSVIIRQVIVVSKSSHKKIILGRGGSKIKEISYKARKNIEKFLEIEVHLFLFIKIREEWQEKLK